MKIKLQRVYYMPKQLKFGVLYVSNEFSTAAHLCACGCGSKIRTPLNPTEWALEVTDSGPSLYPSVGNWQQTCKSHYWIQRGKVVWDGTWTPEQITAGRQYEEAHRRAYFNTVSRQSDDILRKVSRWIKNLFVHN